VTSSGTRNFLALLAGLAVLYFGSSGSDGQGPSSAVVVLAVAAAATVWYLARPQNSGTDNRR
jgi:hypothetical protein